VDNLLSGGGARVMKVGDKAKVARMIGAIEEDGQSRPKAIPNNTTTFVMADTFNDMVDRCYRSVVSQSLACARITQCMCSPGA